MRMALTLSVIAAIFTLAAGTATASQTASVITVSTIPTTTDFTVTVALPKTIWNQSIDGKKSWGLDVTIAYLSTDNTVELVDTSVVPVSDWSFVSQVDSNTVAVQMVVSYAGHLAPSSNPSYTTTATLSKL